MQTGSPAKIFKVISIKETEKIVYQQITIRDYPIFPER